MATQEFYIRAATETDARGPFTLEQLITLAEAGQVTPETLYYEATTEQWAAIDSNPEVKASLFPDKKRLKVKAREVAKNPAAADKASSAITVNDMLAAAEGKTHDTADKADPMVMQLRAARIGLWAVILLLLASCASLVLAPPAVDFLIEKNYPKFFTHPFALLGALDLVLALLLGLQMVTVYPFVRFRAILGLGFLGFVFWSQGETVPIIAVGLASAGIYFCTIFISYLPLAVAVAVGFSGAAGFAYYMLA
ncbi:MAG TPA: DUF4339 domain-containing protein [Opitutaceae bacterium]|jgi:hypothetical protein|nr:DUF4339 domain-containing protein [Opitutaceae bacterium]HRE04454.1 DUF4339 domain-containing protein [Opitutaceae bacterium]